MKNNIQIFKDKMVATGKVQRADSCSSQAARSRISCTGVISHNCEVKPFFKEERAGYSIRSSFKSRPTNSYKGKLPKLPPVYW